MKYLFIFGWLFCALALHKVANFNHLTSSYSSDKIIADTLLNVLAPAKGEGLRASSTYQIKWESKQSGNLQIDLYKADKLDRTLEFSALSVVGKNNIYTWNIPADIVLGEDYQIVVFDLKDKNISAKSEIFSIQKSKKLPKWVIVVGSVGLVAIIGAVVLILGRPKTRRLPDPPNPDE
jgi:hypothetical protein